MKRRVLAMAASLCGPLLWPTATDARIVIEGQKLTSVSGRVLTAPAMDTHNTFEAPNRVQPAPFAGATLQDASLEAQLPPRSVVVLTLAGS